MSSRRIASRTSVASPRDSFTSGGGLRTDPALVRGLTCPKCLGRRVTKISMQLTDGTPVDFVSCHDCEHKHWRNTDGTLALAGVLDRARKPR
jgi:DNA-directed RNA polymerase subunit M/transcription elongation factor TFIIS